MTKTEIATSTITLSQSGTRVAVAVDGEILGTVKDGGWIVRNADRMLSNNGIRRVSAYSLNADRQLTAMGL